MFYEIGILQQWSSKLQEFKSLVDQCLGALSRRAAADVDHWASYGRSHTLCVFQQIEFFERVTAEQQGAEESDYKSCDRILFLCDQYRSQAVTADHQHRIEAVRASAGNDTVDARRLLSKPLFQIRKSGFLRCLGKWAESSSAPIRVVDDGNPFGL